MGRGKGSAYDGNLAELRGWHVAAICQRKTKQGYLSFLFYCVDDQGEWRKEGSFEILGTRAGILHALAKIIYKQPSWKSCEMIKGNGHGKPVDMGPDSEDVFVQIMGPDGYDIFNLRYWDGSVVYEPGKDKASIKMVGNQLFLTNSKKETIDGIRKEALDLVKQRGEKKKDILKKHRENDSPDESSEKKESGPISNGTEKGSISDRPVASATEDIPCDSK